MWPWTPTATGHLGYLYAGPGRAVSARQEDGSADASHAGDMMSAAPSPQYHDVLGIIFAASWVESRGEEVVA